MDIVTEGSKPDCLMHQRKRAINLNKWEKCTRFSIGEKNLNKALKYINKTISMALDINCLLF